NDEPTRLRWRNRYLEGRIRYLEEELQRTGGLRVAQVASALAPTPATPAGASPIRLKQAAPRPEGVRPPTLPAPRGGAPDDLRQITGIGPKIQRTLNDLGIYHFDQIAAWTQKEIDWVNTSLSFAGRIERDKWVAQARELSKSRPTAS